MKIRIFLVFIFFTFSTIHASLRSLERMLLKQNRSEHDLNHDKAGNKDFKHFHMHQRMEHYHVPAVSIAIIDDDKVAFTKGYGKISNDADSKHIKSNTLFQAASISKSINAFGALLLVQQGKLSLDEDVNNYLKTWKIPENIFTKSEKVTLRRLLSHTAGTNVHGFPGYSSTSTIPTTQEILAGLKPIVNTEAISVISMPGAELRYSGGGTTIVQLLIEDITEEPYHIWMKNNVLEPLGMFDSTFEQPFSPTYAKKAAYGHQGEGKKIEGNWHVYPEMAAAGLWTNPNDLAKLILYIQNTIQKGGGDLLNYLLVKEMITRQKINGKEIDSGLGFFIQGNETNTTFSHNGQDAGFIAQLTGFVYHPKGVVIMMNNDTGWPLMQEITNSVSDNYKWENIKLSRTFLLQKNQMIDFEYNIVYENFFSKIKKDLFLEK